jgi:hypothetical protein
MWPWWEVSDKFNVFRICIQVNVMNGNKAVNSFNTLVIKQPFCHMNKNGPIFITHCLKMTSYLLSHTHTHTHNLNRKWSLDQIKRSNSNIACCFASSPVGSRCQPGCWATTWCSVVCASWTFRRHESVVRAQHKRSRSLLRKSRDVSP